MEKSVLSMALSGGLHIFSFLLLSLAIALVIPADSEAAPISISLVAEQEIVPAPAKDIQCLVADPSRRVENPVAFRAPEQEPDPGGGEEITGWGPQAPKRPSDFSLELTARRTKVYVGETVVFTERLRNESGTELISNFRVVLWDWEDLGFLQVPVDEKGVGSSPPFKAENSDTPPWGTRFSPSPPRRYAPGASQVWTHSQKMTRAGIFMFQARWETTPTQASGVQLWEGAVESNWIEIQVVPK